MVIGAFYHMLHSPCRTDISNSNTPAIKWYYIDLSIAVPPTSYTLVVSPSTPSDSEYRANSIPTIAHLLTLITSQSSIPLPALHKLDTSLTLLPCHYLLLSSPPHGSITLSNARKSNIFTSEENARIDLQLGLYLRQLHSIQN